MQRFPIKRLADGRALINLGSSARVAAGWNNLDFSWLLRLGRHQLFCALLHRYGVLSTARYERIQRIDQDMIVWDLRKGIPFPDRAFDMVYHCHVLEHIDREAAPAFLRECRRVLKPGGTLRVVVPDLETLARRYVCALDAFPDPQSVRSHQEALEGMIDQMVIRTPKTRREQPLLVGLLEHVLIGNTARAGILHRWMYDRVSLTTLLGQCGFEDISQVDERTSRVAGWVDFRLDSEPDGSTYKPNSLYVEATCS